MKLFLLPRRIQMAIAMGLWLAVSPAWGERPIEKLKLVTGASVLDSEASYSCVNESGLARAQVTVNFDSQWVNIDLGAERGQFSGVATKALFTKGADNLRALHLSNNGQPFFYDFSLVTDLGKKRTVLTLKFGAGELTCTD